MWLGLKPLITNYHVLTQNVRKFPPFLLNFFSINIFLMLNYILESVYVCMCACSADINVSQCKLVPYSAC